jgi:hypothetical protein
MLPFVAARRWLCADVEDLAGGPALPLLELPGICNCLFGNSDAETETPTCIIELASSDSDRSEAAKARGCTRKTKYTKGVIRFRAVTAMTKPDVQSNV